MSRSYKKNAIVKDSSARTAKKLQRKVERRHNKEEPIVRKNNSRYCIFDYRSMFFKDDEYYEKAKRK